jgi:hypothetical protein
MCGIAREHIKVFNNRSAVPPTRAVVLVSPDCLVWPDWVLIAGGFVVLML